MRAHRRSSKLPLDTLIKQVTGAPTWKRCAHDSTERYPVSIASLVQKTFSIDSELVAARFRDRVADSATAYASNPNGQSRLGLEHLVYDAIHQYRVQKDRVELLSNDVAQQIAGRPSARLSNVITLLSCALLADDRHPIVFEAPQARPVDEEELLKAAARLVYKLQSRGARCARTAL